MDVDLSRAGGMSRLLRQGKASEHTLHWTGLRRHSAGYCPSLRGTKVPRGGCRAQRNVSPCAHILARRRHQSAITHVSALNARRLQGPLVPLWPFTTIGAATTLPGDSRHCKLDK